jgi:hypothetical protein
MGTASRVVVAASLAAVVAGGPVVSGASVAVAAQRATLTVTPSMPRAGQHVTLVQRGGCRAREITATSRGFEERTVTLRNRGGSFYVGTARVRSDARVGERFRVVTRCPRDGESVTAEFTIGRGATGGARAGEGGSIAGMNATTVAAGSALLAAAGAASVLVIRRRARQN